MDRTESTSPADQGRERRRRGRRRAEGATATVDHFDIAVPSTRRSRLPEVALGVLVVAVSALVALWWFTRATETTAVLALANDVGQGEVLEADDLVVARVNTDDEIEMLGRLETSSVVGRVAKTDLPAGVLVVASLFAAEDALQPGGGVVGLDLEPGEVPASRLVPGSAVSVVITPRAGDDAELIGGGAVAVSEVVVDAATVVETAPVGTSGRQFVALAMSAEEARVVAVAASQDRVRLIQVARPDANDVVDVEGG